MANKANVYPRGTKPNPTVLNSDSDRANVGVCFSGGGSRALTCAWGQMLGLKTLGFLEKFRYISSVSGGTWASSIYTFLPESISETDLLGQYYPPENLSMSEKDGCLNISKLSDYSFGHAPYGMCLSSDSGEFGEKICEKFGSTGIAELAIEAILFLINPLHSSSEHKWLWASLVSKFILEPFKLRAKGTQIWNSSMMFSLSKEYTLESFPNDAPDSNRFFYTRKDRPFIIMNNNIMDESNSKIVMLPNQVTPVAGGASGETPDKRIIGGGLVESYAVCSTLNNSAGNESPVEVDIEQPYSLIDIVSTSSAFFAEALADLLKEMMDDDDLRDTVLQEVENRLPKHHKEGILKLFGKGIDKLIEGICKVLEDVVKENSFGENIIPAYNYWPVEEKSENRELKYTDGGSLENTGILGMLVQTDIGADSAPLTIVSFDNTATPISKENNLIIAGGQIAPLFGIFYDDKTGESRPFTKDEKNPNSDSFEAASLIQVFDNSESAGKTPFQTLVNSLYDTSCGAGPDETADDNDVTTEPSFCRISLTTLGNRLAGVSAGRKIDLLYIQNAKMLNWQNRLRDESLKTAIEDAQESSSKAPDMFKNFPYYSTITKIGLQPEESQALSQMWAWALCDDESSLGRELNNIFKSN